MEDEIRDKLARAGKGMVDFIDRYGTITGKPGGDSRSLGERRVVPRVARSTLEDQRALARALLRED